MISADVGTFPPCLNAIISVFSTVISNPCFEHHFSMSLIVRLSFVISFAPTAMSSAYAHDTMSSLLDILLNSSDAR